jgi:hypothetical protein
VIHQAEVFEFPFLAQVPRRPGRIARFLELKRRLDAVTEEKGPIFAAALVAKVLGISNQRIHQLIEAGHIEAVNIDSHTYVSQRSVESWLAEERKGGRPPKVRGETVREAWAVAREVMEEMKAGRK